MKNLHFSILPVTTSTRAEGIYSQLAQKQSIMTNLFLNINVRQGLNRKSSIKFLPILILIFLLAILGTAQGQTTIFSQNFDGSWTMPTSLSPAWSGTTTPADNIWHRNDYTTGWTNPGTGSPSASGANSTTNYARFHTNGAANASVGVFVTPSIDLSGFSNGSNILQFYYINPSGTDVLNIYLSTDGGNNYGSSLRTLGATNAWALVSLDLGTASSAATVKFAATSDHLLTDIGIDEVTILNGYSYVATGSFTAPSGVSSVTVECWGGGGGGGGTTTLNPAAGGGGAGGSYARKVVPVSTGNSYTVTVGAGGSGGSATNGDPGGSTWFGTSGTVYAQGGAGGSGALTASSNGTAGAGSSSLCIGDQYYAGGSGTDGVYTSRSGAGGGAAGSLGNGGNANGSTAGSGASLLGGSGGAGITTGSAAGNLGAAFGGGGSGGKTNSSAARAGGAGGTGLIVIKWYSLSSVTVSDICAGSTATVNLGSAAANLPAGTYTVTYSLSGANLATDITATMTVSVAGTGSFNTSTLAAAGSTTITISKLASGIYSNGLNAGNSATFNVDPATAISSQSTATQTQCINGTFSPITVTATGTGTLTYQWYSNTSASATGGTSLGAGNGGQTNSYTPQTSVVGTLYYYCIVTGTCATATSGISGAFIVNPATVLNSQSTATQTQCINGSFTAITVTATGTGTLTYQWYSNASAGNTGGTSLNSANGAQSSSYTPQTTTAGTLYYYCIVTGTCGTATSAVSGAFIVNPSPTVSNTPLTQTICSGSSSTLVTLTSNVSGATFAWTATASTGVSGFTTTGTSTIPVQTISTNQAIQGTVTFAITPTANTCAGSVYNYTVLVNPNPTMSSASTKTICSGTAVNLVLTSNISSAYTWIATANANVTGASTTLQNTGTINNNLVNLTTTAQDVVYTVTPTSTVGSCAGTPQPVTITVDPTPTVSNSPLTQTICSGSGTTLVTLTSNVGGATFAWTATATTGVSGFTASGTSTIPVEQISTIQATQGTVTYAITPTANSCAGSIYNYTVLVNPTPAAPTGTASQSFCSDASPTVANLTATGTAIQWYAGASGGTALAASVALVSGTHYYASQTISGCESSTRFNVTATVNTTPGAPTGTAAQSFCSGASPTVASLTATGTGIKWYSASSGGTALATSVALVNGTHYYASQTTNGCESSARFDVAATVNTTPAAPTGTAAQIFCNSGTVAGLAATGTSVLWYAAASGGTALVTSTALVSGTHYYASQTVNGCESSLRFDVTVTLYVPAAPTGTASQSFCSGASPTVANLTATGTAIQWYAASTGGTALATSVALVNGTHYYASQTTSGCESSTRFNVTATVNTTPGAPTGTAAQSFCSGASPTVANLTATGTAIKWYAATSGGTSLATSVALVNGTHYYASQTTNGCESSARFDVTATVNTTPGAPTGTVAQTFCNSGTVAGLAATGTSVLWYAAASGGSALATSTALVSGTHYYASQTVNGCESSLRFDVTVTLNVPAAPTGTSAQTFCSGASPTVANLTATGTGIQWYAASTGGTALATSTALADATHYFASQTINGCESSARFNVTATVNSSPTTTGVSICPGGSGSLTASATCTTTNGTAGPNNAGTGADVTGVGTVTWGTPGNITSTGTPYATMSVATSAITHYLQGSNYGFAIPANATINGITVVINRQTSGITSPYLQDSRVSLVKAGSVQTTNKAVTGTNWTLNTFGTATYGGTADLWGTTWTVSDINNTNFGVVLSAVNASAAQARTATVDYMQITVTYSIPGTLDWYTASSGGLPIYSGSSFNPVGVSGSGLANTNTAGTTTYYAVCSTITSGCRAPADFIINALPAAPSLTVVQPTCSVPTGSITVNAPTGIGMTYSINGSDYSNTTGIFTSVSPGGYTVTAKSSAGCTSPVTNVTINSVPTNPATPGAISGTTTQCPALTAQTYNITAVPGATTYTWTVPTGWAITSGQGSVSIGVTTGAAGDNGTISVTAGNTCGTSTANTLAVTVISGPVAAGSITGTPGVCQGESSVVYSVPAISGATSYIWAYSGTGATITGTSNNITINFAAIASSGNLTVQGSNSCGTGILSAVYPITVNSLPTTTYTLSAPATTICSGSGSILSLSGSQTGVNYQLRDGISPVGSAVPGSGGAISFASVSPLSNTTYNVLATNSISGCNAQIGNTVTVNVTASGSWLGTNGTDWNDPANWCGGIPDAGTNVVIPAGGNQPHIGAAGGLCNNITINGTLTIDGAYNLTVSGNWTNNGTFTASTGTVNFNLSSGTQIVNNGGTGDYYSVMHSGAGTLQVSTNQFLTTNSFTNSGGGIVDLNGVASPTLGDLQGSGTITSNVVGAVTFTVGSDGANTTFSGVIQNGSGTVSLNKNGSGSLTLSGNNTYSGTTTISAGTIKLGATGTSPNGPLGTIAGATTVSSGAVLDLNGYTLATAEPLTLNGTGISLSGALINSGGAATYSGLITLGSASSIVGGTGAITLSNTGTITGSGSGLILGGAAGGTLSSILGTGAGILTKADAGTWTVSGASTYTGQTTISGGTLKLGATGGGTNTPLGTTAAGTTVSSGAALDLNGYTLGTAEALSINGTGISSGGALTNSSATAVSYSGNITLAGASSIIANNGAITLQTGNLTGAFGLTLGGSVGGTITRVIAIGAGTLIKDGTGTWTLSGANTYTGTTTITLGELRLNPAANLSQATQFVLNGGTLSTTNITTGRTINTSTATLRLNESSTLALGANVHTLTFANSSGVSWTSLKTLTITGWTGAYNGTSGTAGKIIVGTTSGGLTAGQLAQIQFYNGSAYFPATILSTGEVVPLGYIISAGTVSSSPFCISATTSASGTVAYTSSGTYTSATFTAYISDATGTFSGSPPSIGSVIANGSNPSGNITITIPAGTTSGAGYKIRIDCASPAVTGVASSAFTIVNGVSNVTSPSATTGVNSATLTWTNPANCYDAILIVAKAGSPVTGTPSGDGSAYIANLAYGSGTAFGGGFVVYKNTTSPETITSLINGTQYYFKFFTRKGTDWSSGVEINATPPIIECAYGSATNSGIEFTPCINMTLPDQTNDNGTNINVSTSFAAYQYFVMNVIKGLVYEIYTCSTPANALKISIYEEGIPAGNALAASNSNTGNPCSSNTNNAYLTFTSPLSGQVRVLINQASDCAAATVNGLTVKAKAISGSNIQDNQLAAGDNNSWIGHIYDGENASTTYLDAFSNYIGYYTKTGTLNEIFGVQGTDDYCFGPLLSNGVNRASIKNVTFSARFRKNSTLHGLYVVDITSDDGARATVDGNLIYDNWNVHDNTINAGVLINLTGSSNIVVDFYEQRIDNAIIFNIISPPVLANTLTANTAQTVCIGNPGVTISGDVYGTLPNSPLPFGIALVGTGYQWTYSTTPGGARTNIPGATGATFTPNSSVTPFNVAGTYYIYRNGIVASTNYVPASSVSPYVATNESNPAIFTVSPPPPAAPVAQNASALTYTGFTANWDASAGATGYTLDVSTSNTFAGFVTGYNNLNVSNVNAYPVSGIIPGTYYYRVRAYNSLGGCASENSGTITVEVLPLTYTYQSRATGIWGASSTWDVSTDYGLTWTQAALNIPPIPPPTSADGSVTILNTHTVYVTANETVDQVTVNSGGAISVNPGMTLTIADGPGTDLLNNGTITALTAPFTSSAIVVAGQLANNATITTTDYYSSGIISYGSLTIGSGATLTCSPTSVVSGTGDFILANGGTIEIGSSAGISSVGINTGNVKTAHVRSYSTGANYTYIGIAAQVSGNGLPSTVNNLTINNTAAVPALSLSSSTQVNGNLTLTSGRLILGIKNLTLGTTASIGGSFNASNMIVADNTGKVIKNYSAVGSYTFPVGSTTNTPAYSPITINVAAGTFSSAHIDVNLHDVAHPLIPSSNYFLKRYFSVATTGISGLTYGATFNYVDLDINGNENYVNPAFYSGTTWSYPAGSVNVAGNQVTMTGLLTGGDLTAASNQTICSGSLPANITISGYTGTIQWQKSIDNFVADISNISGATSATLLSAQMGALAVTTYYRAAITNGSVSYSAVEIVAVVQTPTTVVATAATNMTSTGFTANWDVSSGATGYFLDVSASNTFTSYLSGYQNLNVSAVNTYPVTVQSPGTYYYRIRAYNSNVCTTGNSNIMSVSTLGNGITAGTVSTTPLCVSATTSASATVAYTSYGIFSTATFTAKLSDAAGSFTNATDIGTAIVSGTNPSGTINIVIPAGTLSGAGYKIRIDCFTPAVTGTEGPAFEIVNGAVNVSSPTAISGTTSATLSWINPAGCYDEIMIVAQADSTISVVPAGNAYNYNLAYGSGTAFDGGYVVYKGNASPEIVTGLIQGKQYYFKFFTRKGTDWSIGTEIFVYIAGLECAYGDATDSNVGVQTLCANMSSNPTTVSTSFAAHQYFLMNVIKGLTYEVYTCSSPASKLKISVYADGFSTPALAASTSNTGNTCSSNTNNAYLTFTSTISGLVRVLINQSSSCSATTPNGLTVKANIKSGSNTKDDQLAAGTDSWVVHYYDATNSAKLYNQTFTNYIGYNTLQGTLNEVFGGGTDGNCLGPIKSNGADLAYLKNVTFSTRYRMNSTLHGLYTTDIVLERNDGARLAVDGNLIFSIWPTNPNNNTNPGVLMNLTGNSNLVVDYSENTGTNFLGFNIITPPVLANMLNTNATQNVCLGSSGDPISGDVFGTLPLGISLVGTGYQWTYSLTPGGPRINCPGVSTGATYTPNTANAPFNAVGTYYIYRNGSVSSTNNVPTANYTATNESNAAILNVSPFPPAAPNAIVASNMTFTGFSANWQSSSTATGYYLDISTSNTFTSFLPGYNNRNVSLVYTFPVSGLSAGTYYYRVRAYNSAVCSSPSSNVITVVVVPVTYTYRSRTSGNWESSSTWDVSIDNGVNWIAASSTIPPTPPPTYADATITVRSTHLVSVTEDLTVDQLTIETGGTIEINSGLKFTVADGTGADLLNNGVITMLVSPFTSSAMIIAGQLVNNSNIITQDFNSSGIIVYSNVTVNSGATLTCSPTSLVSGTGDFTLANGSSIEIGSVNGISAIGTNTGNVRTTHLRSFGTGSNYSFVSDVAQATGNGLPSSVSNLTINNTAPTPALTLTSATQVNGNLTLTSGRLILGTQNLTLETSTTIVGSFNANTMIVADNTGKVIKNYSATGSFTFPVGSVTNTTAYSPITINVTAGTFSSAHIDVNLHDVVHPQVPSENYYLKRYWTVATSGISGLNYEATYNYADPDIFGFESRLNAVFYTAATWSFPTGSVAVTGNQVAVSGLVTGGDLTAAGKIQVDILSTPSIPTICPGSSITLYAGSDGGKSPYTFNWNISPVQSTQTITVSPVGNTTYTVTVTDALGMSTTKSIDVSVSSTPSVFAGIDASIAPGLPYAITDATTSGFPILWTSNGPGTLTGETTISPTYTPSGLETSPVILTLTVGTAPCSSNDQMTINYIVSSVATWTGGAYDLDWNTEGNWDGYAIPGAGTDVIIPNGQYGNYPTISTAAICNNITLQSDATLVVNEGATLTVGGSASVERLISNDWKWHFLSSPVVNQQIWPEFSPTPTGSPLSFGPEPWNWDFYYWNTNVGYYAPSLPWVNIRKGNGIYNNGAIGQASNDAGYGDAIPVFQTGRGYLIAFNTDWTTGSAELHTFTGSLHSGAYSVPIVNNTAGQNAYNLLGNPYPSALDWKAADPAWDRSNVKLNGLGYDYWIFNDNIGSYGAFNSGDDEGMGTNNVDRYIAPTQAFFVEATASGTIGMTDAIRAHSLQPWLKKAKSSDSFLKLKFTTSTNKYSDEMVVSFNPAYSDNGTAKMWSFYGTAPEICSVKDGAYYCIDRRDDQAGERIVNIYTKIGEAGIFTITASNINLFSIAETITLIDLKTGVYTDLRTSSSYSFTGDPADDPFRFRLVIGLSTSIDKPKSDNLVVFDSDGIINVLSNTNLDGNVKITDMSGRLVATKKFIPGSTTYIDLHKQSGVYVVSLITNKGISNVKVVIK